MRKALTPRKDLDLDEQPSRPTPPRPAPEPRPSPAQQDRLLELIRATVREMGMPGSTTYVRDDPEQIHAERLAERGLDTSAAWRQARALVQDAVHRANCEICGGRHSDEVPF